MEAEGRIWLTASPADIWSAMTDPEVLRHCVPGCKSVSVAGPHDYRFDLEGRWGVIRAKFRVQVLIEDLEPADAPTPARYRLAAAGEGPLGLAKGRSRIELAPENGGTYLIYAADGLPDERLGRLGKPVLRRAADMLSRKFFDRFATQVNQPHTRP
jgi:hypothetical protein